jgi:hypothetical protein
MLEGSLDSVRMGATLGFIERGISMFTVGQTFVNANDPSNHYVITSVENDRVYVNIISATNGALCYWDSFWIGTITNYVERGTLVAVESVSLEKWFANRHIGDALSSTLSRQIYAICERLTERGDMAWTDFDTFNSADYATGSMAYFDCLSSDSTRLPATIRDAAKSQDGIVYGLPVRSLRADTFTTASVGDTSKYQPIKLGKVLRGMFPAFSDHLIAAIVDGFKARHDTRMSFALVKGEEIRHWYNESTYHPEKSNYSLDSSCMRYEYCQPFLDIYAANPDRVSMIIATIGDMLVGRALVWKLDNGGIYVDRAYGEDMTASAMLAWYVAEYPDAVIRSHSDGDSASACTLRSYDFSEYPYMDSMRYLSMETGEISSRRHDGHYRVLTNTDGGFDQYGEPIECPICGGDFPSSDGVWHDYRYICEDCHSSIVYCERCGDAVSDVDDAGKCDYCAVIVDCQECGFDYHPSEYVSHIRNHHPQNGPWFPLAGPSFFDMSWMDADTYCRLSLGYPSTEEYEEMRFAYVDARRLARQHA